MSENDFLVNLNNIVVTDNYTSDYFNTIFEIIRRYCKADAIVTDKFRKDDILGICDDSELSDKDILIKMDAISKKVIIKNVRKIFKDKDFFVNMLETILNNIFKNYLLIEKLKKDKYMDSLLGVYNRTAYSELLQRKRKYNSCAVVFVDANGLGIVNNKYGHEEGDKFLINVSKTFKESFRYSDIYRIGGDELVIICEDIDETLFKEKLQNSLEKLSLTKYTVSVGSIYKESIDDIQLAVREAGIIMKRNKEEYRRNNPDKYVNKYDVIYEENNVSR